MPNIRIGIAGATGYSGRELLRLAVGHPNVDPVVAMASTDGHHDLPALDGIWKGAVEGFSLERLAQETDVVFLSLPQTSFSCGTYPNKVTVTTILWSKLSLRPRVSRE